MRPDDPLLQQRRCDARIPGVGLVCMLEQGHDGTHVAEATDLAQLRALSPVMAALFATQIALDAATRALRWSQVWGWTATLAVLVLVGLRVAGL